MARGNDRNYRWKKSGTSHPIITTVEEKSKATSQMNCLSQKNFTNELPFTEKFHNCEVKM